MILTVATQLLGFGASIVVFAIARFASKKKEGIGYCYKTKVYDFAIAIVTINECLALISAVNYKVSMACLVIGLQILLLVFMLARFKKEKI